MLIILLISYLLFGLFVLSTNERCLLKSTSMTGDLCICCGSSKNYSFIYAYMGTWCPYMYNFYNFLENWIFYLYEVAGSIASNPVIHSQFHLIVIELHLFAFGYYRHGKLFMVGGLFCCCCLYSPSDENFYYNSIQNSTCDHNFGKTCFSFLLHC